MKKFQGILSIILVIIIPSLHACAPDQELNHTSSQDSSNLEPSKRSLINPEADKLSSRIKSPIGAQRIEIDSSSFGFYLRHLPLRESGSMVRYFNGLEKDKPDVYIAVVDAAIGNKDLHQCADAVMRLKAEYHWRGKEFDKIHFDFTNGFRADYTAWKAGKRITVNGNSCHWRSGGVASDSYQNFWSYMEMVFSYAGTLSLSRELISVPLREMQVGDVFIRGGSPGHAVIVVDMAIDSTTGKKYFMLAQSYMPAQEIQILINPIDGDISPWYALDFQGALYTPEWTFDRDELMRFAD